MRIYDTLIVGSGYFATGCAMARGNSVICEEHQVCDTGFYLPLRSFHYHPYTPKTREGDRLLEIFRGLSLFSETEQNTQAFEIALCQYLLETKQEVLLKCRVIDRKRREDGVFDATVQTNEGLTHLFAREVLDTVGVPSSKQLTVLFTSELFSEDSEKLLAAFAGAGIEPAFYPNRYALHLPVAEGLDENQIKVEIYRTWKRLDISAKILYMAPVFFGERMGGGLCDRDYDNPIEAFEAGYRYGKEEMAK